MNWRIETLIRLPARQKLLIIVLILILESLIFYLGFFAPRQEEYAQLISRLTALRTEVVEKRKIADNLPRLKQQFELLNLDLRHALTELPNQKEIPTLLTGITSAGKAAGLDFLIFRPKSEEPKDFYASVPVDISVAGTYHEVADFFNSVGNLPRIVNIGNVSFAEIREAGGRNLVRVNCLATTFRFLEKKEIPNEGKKK
jgi:type IV pilus assembly protein PilO